MELVLCGSLLRFCNVLNQCELNVIVWYNIVRTCRVKWLVGFTVVLNASEKQR